MYKVLWFDDEHDRLEYLREEAALKDIELLGYANAEEGLVALEGQIDIIDAVIVDGIFHLRRGSEGMATTNEAFEEVAKRLHQVADRRSIPCFILSGQISFTQDDQRFAELLNNPKIYDKTSDEDRQELWDQIINQAQTRVLTQIRIEHPDLFSVCTSRYIGEGHADIFLDIFKQFKEPYPDFKYSFYFFDLRKIVEGLFRTLARYGILHEKCVVDNKVNIALSSHFLAGNPVHHLQVKRSEPAFTDEIANSVWTILHETNKEIHQDRSSVADRKSISSYQLYAATFELVTVLLWAKEFIDQNEDFETNKSYWIDLSETGSDEWLNVELIEINKLGWGMLQRDDGNSTIDMPPSMIRENRLKLNHKFKITTKLADNGKIHVKDVRMTHPQRW